jgi:hypothetical protein
MSLFSSFLIADTTLQQRGFRFLGSSFGGCIYNKSFWLALEGCTVAEGHHVFGDPQEQYQVSGKPADEFLLPTIFSILRSQHPSWTRADCEAQALRWCKLLGFAPKDENQAPGANPLLGEIGPRLGECIA